MAWITLIAFFSIGFFSIDTSGEGEGLEISGGWVYTTHSRSAQSFQKLPLKVIGTIKNEQQLMGEKPLLLVAIPSSMGWRQAAFNLVQKLSTSTNSLIMKLNVYPIDRRKRKFFFRNTYGHMKKRQG